MPIEPLYELLQEQTTLVEVVACGWHSEVAKGACCLRPCVHELKQCDIMGAKEDVVRALSRGIHYHLLPFRDGKMQPLGTTVPYMPCIVTILSSTS
jgi:hypothetical protein